MAFNSKIGKSVSVGRLLFQNAKTPAFIAFFKNKAPKLNQHLVEFIAPKFNRNGLRKGVVIVNPSSRTWIPLADIIAATRTKTAPPIWKRRLWGTQRDQKLIDLLQYLPPLSDLAGTPKEKKRWIKGQGFQPFYPEKAKKKADYPDPKPNTWELNSHFIYAGQQFGLLVFRKDCISFKKRLEEIGASKKSLRRVPNRKLFKSPMILVSQGFGKIAYCDFNVLFQHSLQSIAGSEQDTDLLMFLTAYLRSNLARYFLFHTSANWGSERDKVHLNELLRVPFPLPGNGFISPEAEQIVAIVANKFSHLRDELKNIYKALKVKSKGHPIFDKDEAGFKKEWQQKRKRKVDDLQQEIEPLIYRYFGLTEQEIFLVEDTVRVFIPSSTPNSWRSEETVTLNPVEDTKIPPYANQGLKIYADTLTQTLNQWAEAEGSNYCVCAEGGTDKKTNLAMITLCLSESKEAYLQKSLSQKLMTVLDQYYKSISIKRGTVFYERDILFFHEDKIHIIRPNTLLNWTRTAALNDAAKIYGEIALYGKESA